MKGIGSCTYSNFKHLVLFAHMEANWIKSQCHGLWFFIIKLIFPWSIYFIVIEMEKYRIFQKEFPSFYTLIFNYIIYVICKCHFDIYFCFIDYSKAFDWVDHTKLWVILKVMRVPGHLTCLLRNLYAGQEATARTGQGTMERLNIGNRICQGCILSPYSLNLYAENIMWNAKLDEAQVGIKIARRNINNLRHADDTTLITESEEELKSILMKVKEKSEKTGLKLNIQKAKIMASSSIILCQIEGETMETVTDFTGLQNYCGQWLQPLN